MNDTALMIAATEAEHACKGEPDVIERIRKAMRACHRHWMVTDENTQFKAALVAAASVSDGEERDRITRSSRALAKVASMLQALQAGVPVDIEAMAAEKQDDDLIPLRKLWDETRPS